MTRWWLYGICAGLLIIITTSCGSDIEEPADITLDISDCIPEFSEPQLDIVTWDLEHFPISEFSVDFTLDILNQVNPDILAVQGISNAFALSRMLERTDWKALLYSDSRDNDLYSGYIYNPTEVSISYLSSAFDNDPDFSNPPVKCEVKHLKSDLEVTLFNFKLTCCSDADSIRKREKGLERFKNFLDEKYSNVPVILLGNFVDPIPAVGAVNSFSSFINDSENYRFADADVAAGDRSGWSNAPKEVHSDHIIVSDELFEFVKSVNTIRLNMCVEGYFEYVSTHFPVYISLE